jgi:hypothetical protein
MAIRGFFNKITTKGAFCMSSTAPRGQNQQTLVTTYMKKVMFIAVLSFKKYDKYTLPPFNGGIKIKVRLG